MNKFNAKTKAYETASALGRIMDDLPVRQYSAYVGLDVHKATIAVALAPVCRRRAPEFRGEIPNTPKAVASWWGA